jgi:hypothetical protein
MCRTACLLVACAALFTLGGCPPHTTDPNTVDPNDIALTIEQQNAVQFVAQQLSAFGAVLGIDASLTSSQLNLDSIQSLGVFGTCPTVSFAAGSDTALIEFNFGTGCSSSATGGQTVSGAADIDVDRGTRSAAVTFQNLAIGGHSITGTLAVTVTAATGGGVRLEGTVDVTTADIGHVTGSVTATITTGGVITISTGSLTVASGATSYAVTLANLVIDPVGNGNFVPEGGTATFSVPHEGAGPDTLVVTFTSQSPSTGVVRVQVGSAAAINYDVPGLGG